jgi:hypothetical protein
VSVVAALLLVATALGILWYVHSPYYAIQQIGISIAKKDRATFYEYCDAKGVVNSLTDQLFFQPAMRTHGMSDFQNYVAAGAIVMTKQRMDAVLINAIDRMVTPIPNTSFYHVFPQQISENVYSGSTEWEGINRAKLIANKATSAGESGTEREDSKFDLRDFASSIGRELKNEQQDLKKLAAQRMQEFAASHQDQLIGRMLTGPSRGGSMKDLLAEYGFQSKNIRRMYFHRDEEHEICSIEFFSPKMNADVPISVELAAVSPGELLSRYKVVRMWKVKETMSKLGEDTDTQVQELIRYSLQDISPQAAQSRTKNLINRLSRTEGAQKLLQQLKNRF